jgi:hypothetical protein
MPAGPTLIGEPILTKPRPVDAGKAPAAAPSDIVSRWIGEGPDLLGDAGPVVPGTPGAALGVVGGAPCGAVCGDCCAPSCFGGCCGTGGCCRDRGLFWFSGEYLLWAFRRDTAPPLVTVAPAGVPGAIGQPGTIVAFGGMLQDEPFSGGRFTVGFWLPHYSDWGIEASYFFLAQQNRTFVAGSDGSFSIGRPLALSGGAGLPAGESVEQVALAGMTAGNVRVETSSRLWGVELDARHKCFCGENWHLDFLAGFRYIELDEKIDITENLTTVPNLLRPLAPAGSVFVVSDRFNTRNQFYGGQIGVDYECRWRRWFLDTQLKVALGDSNEQVRIAGNTAFIPPPPGMAVTANGGVLALASNIGTFSKNRFAAVPEIGLKLGYQVTDHLRLFAGYNFLAITDVVRPGDQIDRRVNPAQLPFFNGLAGPAANTTLAQPALPTVLFRETTFWAQGLTAGLEFRY